MLLPKLWVTDSFWDCCSTFLFTFILEFQSDFFFLTSTYYTFPTCTYYCCPLPWAGMSHYRSSLICMAYEIIAMETTWITKSNGVKEKTYFRGLWICARACKFSCLKYKVYGIFWNGKYFINSHYCKVLIFLLWWHHHTHKIFYVVQLLLYAPGMFEIPTLLQEYWRS